MSCKLTLKSLVIAVALSGCASPMQQADDDAKDRQVNTAVEENVIVPFDEVQAKAAMKKGDSTIKGVLYHKVSMGGKNAGSDAPFSIAPARFLSGVKVSLYPATAHLTELLRLEKENRHSRAWSKSAQLKQYKPDERVFKYMQITQTDESGRYFFKNVKPGRYYVVAQNQNVTSTGSETVADGTAVVSNGWGVPIGTVQQYRNQDFRVKTPVEYGEFVEIKPDQKELKLESRMRFNSGHF